MHLSILNSSRNIGRRAHGEGAEAIEERAEASIDGESLELEVKHKDNGSWHPCYVSLRSIFQSFRLEILRALIDARKELNRDAAKEIYATGSSLPDCSHACGPCFPCKRVMVSFKCSVAESCPIVYRCMCRGRYYHVPSN
ncbi:uncharacterized protein A4U43_C08F22310 [Asparagus officinalis]|nr:uncharacterized protein A4U43_C08F22310 [Asparagus officinalis]